MPRAAQESTPGASVVACPCIGTSSGIRILLKPVHRCDSARGASARSPRTASTAGRAIQARQPAPAPGSKSQNTAARRSTWPAATGSPPAPAQAQPAQFALFFRFDSLFGVPGVLRCSSEGKPRNTGPKLRCSAVFLNRCVPGVRPCEEHPGTPAASPGAPASAEGGTPGTPRGGCSCTAVMPGAVIRRPPAACE